MLKSRIAKVIAVLALFCVVLPVAAAPEKEEETKADNVFVIKAVDDLPAEFLQTDRNRGRIERPLKDALQKLPEGYSLKVTIGRFFDQGHGHSTGKLEPYVANYVAVNPDGEEDGIGASFSDKIRLVKNTTWKNGVKHGVETLYNGWPHYKIAEIPWKNGVIEGVKKTFYEDGSLQSETPYVNGEPHGLSKSYAKNGDVTRQCMLKNGERDGELVDYWPETGNKRREINYDMGKVVGTAKKYYANGQLKQAIPFKDNVMHGEEKRFTEDGEAESSRYWWNGDYVSKTEFLLKQE